MALIQDRLQRELNAASGVVERGEIIAQQAAYLARVGHFDQARELILELRKTFSDGRSGKVTVWIMLAEALIYHYEQLSPNALDRIVRAQFLSGLMGNRFLLTLTTAWRAEFEFEKSKFQEAFSSIEQALNTAEVTDSSALSRIYNIVCKTAYLIGNKALAQRCFVNGRSHALRDGDQASIEAIQYNRAAFRLSRLRSEMYLGTERLNDLREVRTEIASARNLQLLTQIQALPEYINLAEARLLMLEQRFDHAFEKLENLKSLGPFPSGTLSSGVLNLELSYCLARMGELEKSLNFYSKCESLEIDELDSDELLAVRWLQRELAEIDARYLLSQSDSHAKFHESTIGYSEMLKILMDGIEKISPSLDAIEV